MNETAKTAMFVGAMVLLGGAAYVSRPHVAEVSFEDEIGREFYPDFTDPLEAASLEILEYDDSTASLHRFKVAKINGVWSIPSHENYPTDAERQLAEAAASLIDLTKLGVAGKQREDHETYGVVDPENAAAGAEGIGKKVTLAGQNDQALAQFIIGKEVKDQEGLRYVRVPGQDPVYRVKMDTSKLSTKFEDWIEEDLLDLNAFDIRKVTLNNYSIDEVNNRIVDGDVLKLTYGTTGESTAQTWQLEGLAENEELDSSKLSDMRMALDDLKIVDVRRKPAGLSSGLRTEEGMKLGVEDRLSLQSRGFFIVGSQLLSNEGEVICTTKDGIVYVLRFGEIAAGTGGGAAGDEDADEKPKQPAGANRYIFVTAQLDESMIPKPELEPLPEEKPAEAENKQQAPESGAPEKDTEGQEAQEAEPQGEQEAQQDQDQKDQQAEPADAQDAERKRIEEENKRKTEEYNGKIEEAKKKVRELNDRFADWYYVISDDVYHKIHLSRDEIVKKKEAAESEEKNEQSVDSPETPAKPESAPDSEKADDDD